MDMIASRNDSAKHSWLDNLLFGMYMLTSSPGGCEYTVDASELLPARETVVIGYKAE